MLVFLVIEAQYCIVLPPFHNALYFSLRDGDCPESLSSYKNVLTSQSYYFGIVTLVI